MIQESLQDTQTYPIVCLRHQESCLYAEIIQVIESRQRCWLRPLFLQVMTAGTTSSSVDQSSSSVDQVSTVYDLRDGSDLLWPLGYFQPASDSEILPLLSYLHTDKPYPSPDPSLVTEQAHIARQQLNRFIQQVWQAKPE